MPKRPKTPCNQPGCPALVEPGQRFCPEHLRQERKRYDRDRGTSAQRGYGANHRKLRKKVLAEEPLCRECLKENKLTPATEMDHSDGNQWNLERSNLQGLCHGCHSRKTVKEQGGFTGR